MIYIARQGQPAPRTSPLENSNGQPDVVAKERDDLNANALSAPRASHKREIGRYSTHERDAQGYDEPSMNEQGCNRAYRSTDEPDEANPLRGRVKGMQ